jgi:hypothetical protein
MPLRRAIKTGVAEPQRCELLRTLCGPQAERGKGVGHQARLQQRCHAVRCSEVAD